MISYYLNLMRKKIAYRLLAYILLFSGLVTVCISAVQLFSEYKRDIESIDDQFIRIEEIFIKPLAQALWFFNEESITLQLEGISNFRDIEYLELIGEEKVSIAVGRKESKKTISRHFPLIHTGASGTHEIGGLTVVATMSNVYSRLYDRLITILISQSIKTFLVSAFIFLIFHSLVIRFLNEIDTFLRKIDLTAPSQILRLPRKRITGDELDQTVSSINEMSAKLYKSYAETRAELQMRIQAEKNLQKAYEDIEQKVLERTHELKTANTLLTDEIQERQQVGHQLIKEKRLAQKYLDVAGVMLVAINTAGEIVLINQKGCEILEVTEKQALGINWFDHFLPARQVDEVKKVFQKLLAGDFTLAEYYENSVVTRTGEERIIAFHNTVLTDEQGAITGVLFSGEDITARKQAELEIRTLRGIVPICSYCKKIRDDKGFWSQVEAYVSKHSYAEFSHGACPECFKKQLMEIDDLD